MTTRLRPRARPARREPTIALINIVFLMLVFFMVAGTLARPLAPALTLVQADRMEGPPPAGAVILHRDGRLTLDGFAVSGAAQVMAARPPAQAAAPIRIVPDRDAAAAELVALARAFRQAGAQSVVIVTEGALR
jgi:biopolymer transport protein ExbD